MFSLIISIIAIALVAALALASIYYGGDAFQEGTAKAEASTVVNQGQQVQAAVTMAEIDEDPVVTLLDELVTNDYLKEVPGVRTEKWELSGTDFIQMEVKTLDICQYVEAAFDGDDSAPEARGVQAFGCFTAVGQAAPFTAYYKL